MFLTDLGIGEWFDKLVKETYSLLGLATFFTAEKECKAWTFKGMKAPDCAGIIPDFKRGFIRAESIIRWSNRLPKPSKG